MRSALVIGAVGLLRVVRRVPRGACFVLSGSSALLVNLSWIVDLVRAHWATSPGTPVLGAAGGDASLAGSLVRVSLYNLGFLAVAALGFTVWMRDGDRRLAGLLTLAVVAMGGLSAAVAAAWLGSNRERLQEPSTWMWSLVVALGCVPGALTYPAFDANYLTGYRNLLFLPLADLIQRKPRSFAGKASLVFVAGRAAELAVYVLAAGMAGDSPT